MPILKGNNTVWIGAYSSFMNQPVFPELKLKFEKCPELPRLTVLEYNFVIINIFFALKSMNLAHHEGYRHCFQLFNNFTLLLI